MKVSITYTNEDIRRELKLPTHIGNVVKVSPIRDFVEISSGTYGKLFLRQEYIASISVTKGV